MKMKKIISRLEIAMANFKAGRIRAVTNMNVLTTGFDHPNIDLIVMARPTLSPGLYLQMAGRGMRVKSGKYKDCLVLDFAENIARHGPVTSVVPPRAKAKGEPGITHQTENNRHGDQRNRKGEAEKEGVQLQFFNVPPV